MKWCGVLLRAIVVIVEDHRHRWTGHAFGEDPRWIERNRSVVEIDCHRAIHFTGSRWCASILNIDLKGDRTEIDVQTEDAQDAALQNDRAGGLIDGRIGNVDRANVLVDHAVRPGIFVRGDDAQETRRGARRVAVDRTIDGVISPGYDKDGRIIEQIVSSTADGLPLSVANADRRNRRKCSLGDRPCACCCCLGPVVGCRVANRPCFSIR